MTSTGTIPNSFIVTGTGFKDCGEGVFMFRDPDSDTNLLLKARQPGGFSWELWDGKATANQMYWEGRLHKSHEITSLLIRFGGNGVGEVKGEAVEFEIRIEDGVMRSSEPIFDGRQSSVFFFATDANEAWRLKGERYGEGIRITEAARIEETRSE